MTSSFLCQCDKKYSQMLSNNEVLPFITKISKSNNAMTMKLCVLYNGIGPLQLRLMPDGLLQKSPKTVNVISKDIDKILKGLHIFKSIEEYWFHHYPEEKMTAHRYEEILANWVHPMIQTGYGNKDNGKKDNAKGGKKGLKSGSRKDLRREGDVGRKEGIKLYQKEEGMQS
ncbi:hypothetical protein GQR58_021812 [Nymphon striatum]|nr:hypothetical protein GQR58_021812 [Nymphon striatum]